MSADAFGEHTPDMYGSAKQIFHQLDGLLNRPISTQKRMQAIAGIAEKATMCSGGIFEALQEAVSSLQCSTAGSGGAAHRMKMHMMRNIILEHVRADSNLKARVGNQVHYVNYFFNKMAADMGVAPIKDPYLEGMHITIKDIDVLRCKQKVFEKIKPLTVTRAMAEQYHDTVQSAAASAGAEVKNFKQLTGDEKAGHVFNSISSAKKTELDGAYGSVPLDRFIITEVDDQAVCQVTSTPALIAAHFLHDLKAQGLVNHDDTVSLAKISDGGELKSLGDLFWVDNDGDCREVKLADFLETRPNHMLAMLKEQGIDPENSNLVLQNVADHLVGVAQTGTKISPEWLTDFCLMLQKNSPKTHPAVSMLAALELAINSRCGEAVKALIEAGVDTSGTDPQGRTALMLAVEGQDQDHAMLDLLVNLPKASKLSVRGLQRSGWRLKSNIDQTDDQGHSALMMAAKKGDAVAVDILLKARANQDLYTGQGHDGKNALMMAAEKGHTLVIEQLLAAKPGVIGIRSRDSAALVLAAQGRHLGAIKALIEAGVDTNGTDPRGRTALMLAVENQDHAMLTLLTNPPKASKLSVRGLQQMVSGLMKSSINQTNALGRSALMMAARKGDAAAVDILVAAGADLTLCETQGHDRKNALMMAAENGHTLVIEKLLAAKPDMIGVHGEYGRTALMFAARNGHIEAVKALLNACTPEQINATAICGDSALNEAADHHYLEVVKALIAAGANLETQNDVLGTPLIQSAAGCHDVVVALLVAGANPNARTEYQGETALMRTAMFRNNEQTMYALLQAGADPNIQNHNGETALMQAIKRGHTAMVEILCASPLIDLTLRDNQGRSAAYYARRNNMFELLLPAHIRHA